MMSKQPFSPHSNTTMMKPSSSNNHLQQTNPNPNPNPPKKKRNLPGTPDPDSEVIAMSPKSLMATNRFVCEICNKGFQRDQNLQLHRRGHNLPWKLKQRTNKEQIKKKVYVCPEKSCVHNDPCRALGDLTGIKKHYSRKHGEKKWKCEKCSKKYAVQSDWKAHSKICGTREYKCDCGTIFSRKDSFITHRAFCDALTDESAKITTVPAALSNFRNDHLTNPHHQAPRFPQIFPGFQFHSEFVGSGTSSEPLGNYTNISDYSQKLRLQPLWSNSSCNTMNDLVQTMDVFGSQTQFMSYTNSNNNNNNNNNICLPMLHHGVILKQEEEEEENKDLSHSVISSMYLSSQNPVDNNLVFNNNNVNHFGNIVEGQKFYKQSNHHEELNELVNLEGGEYLLNDSNNSFGIVNCTKSLEFVVTEPVEKETSTTKRQMHDSSSRTKNQMGLTRDFLGVGEDSMSGPFLHQELSEFNGMGSSISNLQNQYGGGHGHYC
ncbi:uncharacterized protein [Cicer arietinum]|uniref:Zinc finger protein BALDIBIS n=1 Tax=Cicer arietinum TaxID=3827 RepID=A0A1S2YK24_CICAR|nr:zinc finger protein BALDIBIS [Cicer arietinum]